jgi:hypothetical protein
MEKVHLETYNKLILGPTGRIDENLTDKERKIYIFGILKTTLKKCLAFSALCDCPIFLSSQKVLNSTVEGISIATLIKTLDNLVKKMRFFIKGKIII